MDLIGNLQKEIKDKMMNTSTSTPIDMLWTNSYHSPQNAPQKTNSPTKYVSMYDTQSSLGDPINNVQENTKAIQNNAIQKRSPVPS